MLVSCGQISKRPFKLSSESLTDATCRFEPIKLDYLSDSALAKHYFAVGINVKYTFIRDSTDVKLASNSRGILHARFRASADATIYIELDYTISKFQDVIDTII